MSKKRSVTSLTKEGAVPVVYALLATIAIAITTACGTSASEDSPMTSPTAASESGKQQLVSSTPGASQTSPTTASNKQGTGAGPSQPTPLQRSDDQESKRELRPESLVIKKIAFTSSGDIWVTNPDGTSRRNLTRSDHASQPAWSPDGSRIAFTGQHGIYLVNSDGSEVTRITAPVEGEHRNPTWSPDGARIAFVAGLGFQSSEIFVMNADGSDLTSLTPGSHGSFPSWSPDGSEIAFVGGDYVAGHGLHIINSDGSGVTRLTSRGAGFPVWSPDGSQIVFTSRDYDGTDTYFTNIYAISVEGSDQTKLTDDRELQLTPVWSSDGFQIAFVSGHDIHVMNSDGSDRVNITNDPSDYRNLTWGPNATIVFSDHRDHPPGIFAINADGSGLTRITVGSSGGHEPSLLMGPPAATAVDRDIDGRMLYTSEVTLGNRTEKGEEIIVNDVRVMDADGSNQTRLVAGRIEGGFAETARWSRDGRRVAVAIAGPGAAKDVWLMNADGSDRINLTHSPWHDGEPTWSPDGDRVAFASSRIPFPYSRNLDRGRNFDIYVINIDSSKQTNITKNPASDNFPDWSPDGSRIAFASDRHGNPEIYVMNIDGTQVTRLTHDPQIDGTPRWSPDGQRIAFISGRDGNPDIFVMNADGTRQTNLTDSSDWEFFPVWAPSGSHIAFASGGLDTMKIHVMRADGSGEFQVTGDPTTSDRPSSWTIPGSPESARWTRTVTEFKPDLVLAALDIKATSAPSRRVFGSGPPEIIDSPSERQITLAYQWLIGGSVRNVGNRVLSGLKVELALMERRGGMFLPHYDQDSLLADVSPATLRPGEEGVFQFGVVHNPYHPTGAEVTIEDFTITAAECSDGTCQELTVRPPQ